jgi:lantibiotic modifying enzyme
VRKLTPLGFAVAVAILTAAARPAPPDDRYLQAAVEAGKWIRGSAIRTNAGVTWPADPANPQSVDAALYSGAPGVVLFLLDLHQATGGSEYLAEARAGADEIVARLTGQREAGLYTGIAGAGFVLTEVYRATGDARYRDAARRTVQTLSDLAKPAGTGAAWNDVTDIISGSAGTGLFLLYAAEQLDEPSALRLAARAADHLLELGVADQGGLRWAMDPKFPRLMPNFSHGTAGVAYFLASVYQATRERRFLDGALSGAKYLQAIAKTDGDICLIPHHQPDGLDLYYLGWCHGPVGTARLWRKLADATGDAQWNAWIQKSARALMTSGIPEKQTPGFWNNVSQCCGTTGVAQFFLDLYGASREPQYLEFSKKMTADLLARGTRDDKGLRWVQAENRVSPDQVVAQTGYMQGAAGMGMWLLRLHAAEHGRATSIRFPDSPWK